MLFKKYVLCIIFFSSQLKSLMININNIFSRVSIIYHTIITEHKKYMFKKWIRLFPSILNSADLFGERNVKTFVWKISKLQFLCNKYILLK